MSYKIMYKEEDIIKRCKELAPQIQEYFNNEPFTMVGILNGAIMFFCELSKHFDEKIPVEFDFMSCTSYYDGRATTGVVKINKDLDKSIEGKNVLIVEDIIDSGYTLKYVKKLLEDRLPKKVAICTLLDKHCKRKADIESDFVGFEIDDKFVVGYGLDWDYASRNWPFIGYIETTKE